MPFSFRISACLRGGSIVAMLLACAACTGVLRAADHVLVTGYERFYAAEKTDSQMAGKLLLGELNCTSCHRLENPAAASILPKQAPILDGVGNRVRATWLKNFLADPHAAKPGTTMPNLFAGVPAKEKDQQIEALVHFLASLGGPAEGGPARQSVARGDKLFHSVGCVACHDPRQEGAKPLANSVPLGTPSKKYAIPGLAGFLSDPLKVRPSGRMPNLNLTTEEARDIASYLLKDLNIAQVTNTKYKYYEGAWDKVPDFGKLQPKESGVTSGFDLNVAAKRDGFGMRFESFLRIPAEGEYTFYIGSDDGSRLTIDGKQAAASDGVHPFTFGNGKLKLTAGWHEIVVDYFEAGGQEELQVEFEGPGLGRQSVESFLSATKGEGKKPDKEVQFVSEPELIEKGRQVFAKVGCASCHQLQQGGKVIPSQLEATSLAKLKPTGGCLAETPSAGLPKFAFTARQRIVLSTAIEGLSKPVGAPLAPQRLIAHTMTVYNCFACHEREKQGGVEDDRNEFFASNMKEMGDEGRLPPHLTGAGAKLKGAWLKEILANSAKDRPYMFTRMPKFGEANVGQLVSAFESADEGKPDRKLDFGPRERAVKNAGWQLVGDKMLSCIKCHTFNNEKATGIQAISLTTMHKRLRDDWFHKYMFDPQVYRPGTRMPSAWPAGQTFYPDLLDGKVETQINAVWAYLADGSQARLPRGLGREPIEIVAETEAVVYRNFIEGAGPRAIGVGYPEKVNLAFDANNMHYSLVWKGSFMDASKHWIDRGSGFQGPLGEDIVKLVGGTPLAVLAEASTPWPSATAKEQGYQFRGYRLAEVRRPVFLYSLGDVRIEDYPTPLVDKEKIGLRRTITLQSESAPKDLWFRAVVAPKIEDAAGSIVVNDQYRVRLEPADIKTVLRKAGNNLELLMPVKFTSGRAKIVLEYVW